MKLKLSGTGTGFGKIRDAETNHLVASDVRHVDAVEIVRRVNAHEPLLQGCEIALTLIEGTMTYQTAENVASYLRAAIGKAKGE